MKNEIRYIDLFAGVGGFRLGIERACNNKSSAEIEQKRERRNRNIAEQEVLLCNRQKPTPCCVFTSEIDKYCIQIYNKNFGTKIKTNDISTQDENSIPDFDLLCGGFPCQSFSISGKRRGFEDTRGTMFYEIARILKTKKPKYFLLENVKGLLSHDRGRTFAIIITTLSKLGYDVQWMVLNSRFFGVPQNRERVFIIGNLRRKGRSKILPFGEDDNETTRERHTEGMEQIAQTLRARDYANWQGNFCLVSNVYGGFGEEKMREFKEYSPTIRTPKGGGHLPMVRSGMTIRRLTPIECERLQGFPDDWTKGVSDSQRYKQMGNAVTVNVVEAIIKRIFQIEGGKNV